MPKTGKYKNKRYFSEAFSDDANVPEFLKEFPRNNYIEPTAWCRKCSRPFILSDLKSNYVCDICFRNEIGHISEPLTQPGPSASDTSYSNEIAYSNNTNHHAFHKKDIRTDRWERKIYSREIKNSNSYYDNKSARPAQDTIASSERPRHRRENHRKERSIQPSNSRKRRLSVEIISPTPMPAPPHVFLSDGNEEFPKNDNLVNYRQAYHSVQFIPRSDHQAMPSSSYFLDSSCRQTSSQAFSSPPVHHFPGELKRRYYSEQRPAKRFKDDLPLHISESEPYRELNINIWKHFNENCQTDEIFDIKMNLRRRIESLVKMKFPRADVFVFGSSMTGFASKTSDVDMGIMFHNTTLQKNKVINILWQLRAHFRRDDCLKGFKVIPAKVPILKFKDTLSGFEVDLNINNPTGIRNSQLLRGYSKIDDRVRPLVLATKWWARVHDINDAKTGTLSSYSLGLMTIHFLQYKCQPPVLPSLQLLQPDKYLPDFDVRDLRLNEELPRFVSGNNKTVGQLFAGFLHYYSEEFNYISSRISVRLATILPRAELRSDKNNELKHFIDIEEPFELTNVARSANNAQKSQFIKSVFDDSWKAILKVK